MADAGAPPGPTRLVVLPIGYADGISRRLTNLGKVLIRGKQYPMVGTVTMDFIMVDVADDPVKVGDEVIIWGESSQGTIQLAECGGTDRHDSLRIDLYGLQARSARLPGSGRGDQRHHVIDWRPVCLTRSDIIAWVNFHHEESLQ